MLLPDPPVSGPIHTRTGICGDLQKRRLYFVRNRTIGFLHPGNLEKPRGRRGQRPDFAVSLRDTVGEQDVEK